ncbi:hypothetical protein [Arsukibacterium indicum]|uniref:Uncharacterized protein n=1 Tax=Arsukibacterium indicum TaxID=2848612 RepID=A0ABS6MKI6_9GAMM|nr:hypothetical protein [Arsukibacterium indicum]MBV2129335.1 hypothetical protein [Arsukibacterium indicum]
MPEGVQAHAGRSEVNFANVYYSEDCDLDYQLNLQLDGDMLFQSNHSAYPSFRAKWRLSDYPYIQLYQEAPYLNLYYQIEPSESSDILGTVIVIRLLPLSTPMRLPACKLVHGIRG